MKKTNASAPVCECFGFRTNDTGDQANMDGRVALFAIPLFLFHGFATCELYSAMKLCETEIPCSYSSFDGKGK